MVNVEGFFSSIKNALGIPIGVSYRKSYGLTSDKQSTMDNAIFDNPYAEVICDITADDVCRGEEPVSYAYELPEGEGLEELPDDVFEILESFKKELNSIVKWVSKDLQVNGVSVYDVTLNKEDENGEKKKPEVFLLPNLDELTFYLTKDKRIIAYNLTESKLEKKNLEDVIIFINYEKNSLTKVEESTNKDLSDEIVFEVRPTPMQFKNTQGTLDALNLVENALKRYRAQLSRIVRYATVDVGLSNGDTQKDVVEAISSAINADSMNLTSTTNEEYNDNIPVIPTRNGKGAPEMHLEVPQGDIKEVADLKYFLDKLNLLTRFPATYMDFTQAMGDTAVSLIRGDLRYAKMCASVRTLIEKTINDFISQTKSLTKYNVVFSLVQLPTSEDDDVIQEMSNYSELASDIYEFVIGDDEEESIDLKIQRLNMIQGLFNASVKSPVLQKWFDDFSEFIEELKKKKENNEDMGAEGGVGGDGGFGGEDDGDFGGGGDLDIGGDLGGESDLDVGGGEDFGGGSEIESFEPQTEM